MIALRPVRLPFSTPVLSTWPERIEGRYSYISNEIDDNKFGAWARDFKWMTIEEDYDSGVTSPPLWKNKGSPISPDDMTRVIGQYQQEMLDMVREEPECDYELSMKDLVELSPEKESLLFKEREMPRNKATTASKVSRSASLDYKAFLLKMSLPFPGGSRRTSDTRRAGSKVSPKPESTSRIKVGVEKSRDNHHKRRRLRRFLSFFFGISYFSPNNRRK